MDDRCGGARRERKDAQRNLERVLSAAHELFAERGPDVTMEEVARRAGVGVGTIYRRFPSKDHLFAAVSHAACDHTRHCLLAAAETSRDPVQKLRALVVAQYERVAQQAVLIELRPAPDPAGGAAAEHELYATMHALLEQVIRDGQRQGVLRPGEPAALAALCLELISPRAFAHLAHVLGGEPSALAEHAVRFVLGGLGAPAAAEPAAP